MKRKIQILAAVLAVLCLVLAGCGGEEASPTTPTVWDETTLPPQELGELVILFTGGLEETYARVVGQGVIGYGALAALRDRLVEEGYLVTLVDGGDSLAPENDHGDGDDLWDLVDAVGYDLRVPGKLERSMGMDSFLDRTEDLNDCTWIDCDTSGVEEVLPYVLVDAGEIMVGFVGVSAPEWAWDKQGFYDAVQQAIDNAANAGAEYVICVGNLGMDPADTPFTAPEVMANITGYAAFLDCGGESLVEGTLIRDKDDFEVPLCSIGRGFLYIGQVRLDLDDGKVTVELLSDLEEEDKSIVTMAQAITDAREKAEEPTTEPEETEVTTETDPEA